MSAAATTPASAPFPGVLSLSIERTVVEFKVFARNPQQMFFTFLLPVLFLIIFSAVFGNEEIEGPPGMTMNFAQYFLPGIIASGIASTTFTNVASAVSVAQHEGLMKRLSGTPLPRTAFFAGKLASAAGITIVQTALMLALAVTAYGCDLPQGLDRWFVFLVILTVGAATGCLLGLAYTRLIPNATSAPAIIQPPFLILQFISGVYFRYREIPDWLQAVASIFPLRWIAQGLRYAFLPDWLGQDEYGSTWGWEWPTAILAGWFVLSFILARLFFKWDRTK